MKSFVNSAFLGPSGHFHDGFSLSQLSFVALFDSERRVLSRGVTKGWLYLFF